MNHAVHTRSAITHPRFKPDASLRLVCFPYAGGGTTIYRAWLDAMPAWIEVCPVKLPGREDRLFDPPHTNLNQLLAELAVDIEASVPVPFAFFGHSMGAMIAYELTRLLHRRGRPLPVHLLVSGHRAPQLPDMRPPISHLPDDQFMAQLSRMNGTPREVAEHDELMRMLLPVLRADFTLCDTYTYVPDVPLECPISALSGTDDAIANREKMEPWRKQTSGDFKLHVFAGGHFFLNTLQQLVIETVVKDLVQTSDKGAIYAYAWQTA
ncbi:MAG: thioesterase [Chloroflexaceae bacterium]|nr:thioesterase [Chloroflexaceae bacterium]